MSDKRQKNQLELAFTDESRSEAPRVSAEGTESLAVERGTESLAYGVFRHLLKPAESPDADPHVRWCGRRGAARLPPIPIDAGYTPG
jgi:hypothetical protein